MDSSNFLGLAWNQQKVRRLTSFSPTIIYSMACKCHRGMSILEILPHFSAGYAKSSPTRQKALQFLKTRGYGKFNTNLYVHLHQK